MNEDSQIVDEAAISERLKELEKMVEEKFVKDGQVNLYNLSTALQRQIEGDTDAKGPFLGGASQAGWRDPNKSIQPEDLVGRVYDPGLLTEMRYASDVIAPVMNDAEAAVCSLDYNVMPRVENPTQSQSLAAQAVGYALNSMGCLSLERLVSTIWNQMGTYGFSIWEMHMPTSGPQAFKFQMYNIAPWQVEWFNLTDDRRRLKSVRVNNGDGVIDVPAAKLVWFGDDQFTSNYWGMPSLRPVVAAYSAYKEDVKNYLALRRLQKGVLVAKENSDGSNTASWQVVKSWMRRFYAGQSLPLLLNSGMDVEFLQVTQPGIDGYNNMLSYWDSKIRGALNDSLGNLGIDGVGSLALGQEVASNDRGANVDRINRFLEFVNGNTNIDSQLLAIITELFGFDPTTDTPMIVAADNVEADLSEGSAILATWLKDGIVTAEFVGEKNRRTMLESLGFSTDHLPPLEEDMRSGVSSLAEGNYRVSLPEELVASSDFVGELRDLIADNFADIWAARSGGAAWDGNSLVDTGRLKSSLSDPGSVDVDVTTSGIRYGTDVPYSDYVNDKYPFMELQSSTQRKIADLIEDHIGRLGLTTQEFGQ